MARTILKRSLTRQWKNARRLATLRALAVARRAD
jgi:hypothetical protein